jgi:hypothetical protein
VVGKTREFKNAIFPGEPSWTGTLRRFTVTAARGVTLFGAAADTAAGNEEVLCGS